MGEYSNTGGTNHTLTLHWTSPCTPTPVSAASRKTHGAAGTFDVPLPLTGNVGVECRSGGATNGYTYSDTDAYTYLYAQGDADAKD